jgi:hypothetical protein
MFGVSRIALLFAVAAAASACIPANSSPTTPTGSSNLRLAGTVSIVSAGQLAGQIHGARLTVQDGANRGAQVVSDSAGRYSFNGLQSGRFTVVIEASGFVSVEPVVALYQDLEVNFALRRAGD